MGVMSLCLEQIPTLFLNILSKLLVVINAIDSNYRNLAILYVLT